MRFELPFWYFRYSWSLCFAIYHCFPLGEFYSLPFAFRLPALPKNHLAVLPPVTLSVSLASLRGKDAVWHV